MGSQGLDPDGGRALVGCSDSVCYPTAQGSSAGATLADRITCQPVNTA